MCLAFRQQNGAHHLLGRETYLAPVRWDENAWPVVNGNGTISLDMNVPTLPLHPIKPIPARDEFTSENPSHEWVWIRNPEMNNYEHGNGRLTIKGTPVTLDSYQESPSALLRRQEHISFRAATDVMLANASKGAEAGISVYANGNSHYDLFVTRTADGKDAIELRYRLNELNHIEKIIPLDSSGKQVVLSIEGSPSRYTFSYSTDGGKKFTTISSMNTRYLSTECAGGFTGTFIALYTTAPDGKATGVFDYFDYQPL